MEVLLGMEVSMAVKSIVIKLSKEEALALLEEAEDISVGVRPILHELLDRIAEILGKEF